MLTEILNNMTLLYCSGKPTVVIVIVQPAYCCYCSTHKTTRNCQPKTHFFADFAIFLDFKMIPSDFETISGDFERFGHHFVWKFKDTPAGLTLGIGSQALA